MLWYVLNQVFRSASSVFLFRVNTVVINAGLFCAVISEGSALIISGHLGFTIMVTNNVGLPKCCTMAMEFWYRVNMCQSPPVYDAGRTTFCPGGPWSRSSAQRKSVTQLYRSAQIWFWWCLIHSRHCWSIITYASTIYFWASFHT